MSRGVEHKLLSRLNPVQSWIIILNFYLSLRFGQQLSQESATNYGGTASRKRQRHFRSFSSSEIRHRISFRENGTALNIFGQIFSTPLNFVSSASLIAERSPRISKWNPRGSRLLDPNLDNRLGFRVSGFLGGCIRHPRAVGERRGIYRDYHSRKRRSRIRNNQILSSPAGTTSARTCDIMRIPPPQKKEKRKKIEEEEEEEEARLHRL